MIGIRIECKNLLGQSTFFIYRDMKADEPEFDAMFHRYEAYISYFDINSVVAKSSISRGLVWSLTGIHRDCFRWSRDLKVLEIYGIDIRSFDYTLIKYEWCSNE